MFNRGTKMTRWRVTLQASHYALFTDVSHGYVHLLQIYFNSLKVDLLFCETTLQHILKKYYILD